MQKLGTDLQYCFYTDNGSTAVEAAMKMAFQYHKNRGMKTRNRFISLKHAHHGETLGCVSVNERMDLIIFFLNYYFK